jgi:hypothetical protein
MLKSEEELAIFATAARWICTETKQTKNCSSKRFDISDFQQ